MTDITPTLERLRAALDDTGEIDLRALAVDQVGDWVCGLQELRHRFDALICEAATEAANAGVPATAGLFGVASYVASRTRVDPKIVAGDERVGWWLLRHPIVAGALRAGRVSRRHVRVLMQATNPRTATTMHDDQALFVDLASTCDFRTFVQALGYWKLRADPDGAEPAAQTAARTLSITTDDDGSVHGHFHLDPLAGSALRTAVETAAERIRLRDLAAGTRRTPNQRQADALVALVIGGHIASGSNVALIHVVMGEKVVADGLRRLDGDDGTLPDRLPLDWRDPQQRCKLADGTPLHPRYGIALLAMATLRRLVMSTAGEVLDLGRAVRNYPVHLRQALVAQSRGRCQHPGCDAPAAWLQADHLLPWAHAGHSDLDNGQTLCRPHNRQKNDRLPHEMPIA